MKRSAGYRARHQILVFLSILFLAFAIRLYRLDFQSIWWDEGHSILMASAPIRKIPTWPGMDVHPPGYFAALHLWMNLAGRSKYALRYLSAGFSLLTIALLIRFGRLIGGQSLLHRDPSGGKARFAPRLLRPSTYLKWPGVGVWAGLLAATSPFYVAYAQEVRMYAMVTFFAAASVYTLWRLLFVGRRQGGAKRSLPVFSRQLDKRYLLPYILFTTASLYTHYFTIFLLCFENLLWLRWFAGRGRRSESSEASVKMTRLRFWIGAQLGILLLFVPQLRLALRQVTTYANPNLNPPALPYFMVHNWQAYTLGLTMDFEQARPYLWGLFALLLTGCFLYARRGDFVALLAWLLIPLGLYFIVLQRQPSYEPRYLMLITPAIFLLFAVTFAGRRWTNLLGLLALGSFVVGLNSYFANPAYFKDDADGVTAWLATETTDKDIVFVDVPHPFHYYADRIPAPTRYLFVDIHTAADTLTREARGRDRLFWVTWWGSDTDPRGVIPYLLQKQAGPSAGEVQFNGYQVRWYQLSERPFSLPGDLSPIDVNFDNLLRLDGLAYSQTLSPGATAWATLRFTQLAPIDVNYKTSLRLRSPEGVLLAQEDKLILNDRHFQTAAWPIDDPALNQAINVFPLPLGDATYSGPLTLEAVVYNAETLAAIAAYGVPTANDDLVSAQIGQVEVK